MDKIKYPDSFLKRKTFICKKFNISLKFNIVLLCMVIMGHGCSSPEKAATQKQIDEMYSMMAPTFADSLLVGYIDGLGAVGRNKIEADLFSECIEIGSKMEVLRPKRKSWILYIINVDYPQDIGLRPISNLTSDSSRRIRYIYSSSAMESGEAGAVLIIIHPKDFEKIWGEFRLKYSEKDSSWHSVYPLELQTTQDEVHRGACPE